MLESLHLVRTNIIIYTKKPRIPKNKENEKQTTKENKEDNKSGRYLYVYGNSKKRNLNEQQKNTEYFIEKADHYSDEILSGT